MMQRSTDVVVVGGGVIGCAIAWRLSQRGYEVTIVDRSALGTETSRAAAGMLGAQLETHEPGHFFTLCMESRALYDALASSLLDATGIDIELSTRGSLRIATSPEAIPSLAARADWQRKLGFQATMCASDELAQQEPLLAHAAGALLVEGDRNVSAPRLTDALVAAARAHCNVIENRHVSDIQPSAKGVTITVNGDVLHAEYCVVAAGAWSSTGLAGSPDTVFPVKGQLLSVCPSGGQWLRHTVVGDTVYLVPKRDGSIVVGATEEPQAGFGRETTAAGIQGLLQAMVETVPGLADATYLRAWTGLRPTTASREPVLGPHPAYPRLLYATGHYRNGILLTPITADIITAWIAGTEVPSAWRAFAPGREGLHHESAHQRAGTGSR